jgi:ABC-2 type transport system ATP-binding protein
VLPQPWDWIITALTAFAFLVLIGVVLVAPRVLPHRLDERGLHLRIGLRVICRVPRDQVAAVAPTTYAADVELLGWTIAHDPARDALVVTSVRRGLVEIVLREPLTVKVPRQGVRAVSRIYLGVDEPELLLGALRPAAPLAAPPAAPVAAAGPVAPSAAPLAVANPVALPSAAPLAVTGPVTLPSAPGPLADPPTGSRAALQPLPATGEQNTGLVAHGLSKRFGAFQAVRGVSLTVAPGEIVALLGANGAGKSTTLQMMAGLTQPDQGQVWVGGHDVWADPLAARAAFSYVPDTALLHENLTAREFLWFLGDLYGLSPQETRTRTEELLERMGLTARADTWLRGYSLGMKRKVSLAAGLLHRPRVLILDEVTNGLDPRANRDVLNLLLVAARSGTAVLLATHILPVAEEVADRIAILHAGELRAIGTLPELRAAAGLGPTATLEEVFLTLSDGGDHRCA